MKPTVCFLMPFCDATTPIGGLKVVLQYANLLSIDGYVTYVVYPYLLFDDADSSWVRRLNLYYRSYYPAKKEWRNSDDWYVKGRNVKEIFAFSLQYRDVPKADVYIATGVQTARFVSKYPTNDKYYFIQGYENWDVDESELLKTYHLPLKKIAIASWLKNIVVQQGENCDLVPNGFELNKFSVTNPITQRNPFCISMLCNGSEIKNNLLAFRSLEIVHHKHPQLVVNVFGVSKRSENLPEWYRYTQKPTEEQLLNLYNESAIFIGTSNEEGWGLTVGEAMLCGNAIVCSDIDGYKEMVVNNETALLSPVNDAEWMADNICKLIENRELRIALAEKGNECIKRFDINDSFEKLKRVLCL